MHAHTQLHEPYIQALREFRDAITAQGLQPASITNYVSDVRTWFQWLADHGGVSPYEAQSTHVTAYLDALRDSGHTVATRERKRISLGKWYHFARLNLETIPETAPDGSGDHPEAWKRILNRWEQALATANCKSSTLQNLLSDARHFAQFVRFAPLSQTLTQPKLAEYDQALSLKGLSPATRKRHRASLLRLARWAVGEQYLAAVPATTLAARLVARFEPLWGITARWPEKTSTLGSGPPGCERPQAWPAGVLALYQRYSQARISSYLHLAILMVFCMALGLLGYQQFLRDPALKYAYPSAPVQPSRILSFQGRVTDSSGNAITGNVNMQFRLYTASSGGTQLWDSGTCTIDPDQDGVFNTLLGGGGSGCGTELSQNIFSENQEVWLEVQVSSETLTPRQRIATVGYALNSETLQGFPPSLSGTINTIPVISALSQIIIGANNPQLIASSGAFLVQGESMTIQTEAGGAGDITIAPDAGGTVNVLSGTTTEDSLYVSNANLTSGNLIHGYVGNNSGTGNLLYLGGGSVETTRLSVSKMGDLFVGRAATVSGSLTVDTNTLFVDSTTNQVGIGTTSFVGAEALRVIGATRINGNVSIETTGGASRTIDVYSGTAVYGYDSTMGGFSALVRGYDNVFIQSSVGGAGDIIFRSDATQVGRFTDAGNFGVGTDTTPDSLFSVGSTSQFQVNSSGNIAAIGGVAHSLANSSGNLVLTSNGELYLNDTRTGNIALSVADTAIDAGLGQGIVDAINDLYGLSVANSIWNINAGALFPANSTLDLLIGGSSTASADFAFLNVNSGTPTASFSGNLVLAGASRSIQSTENNSLTIGGNTTGHISLMPLNGSGRVGIGTTTPQYTLHITDNGTLNNTPLVYVTSTNDALIHLNSGGGTDDYSTIRFQKNGVTAGEIFTADSTDDDLYIRGTGTSDLNLMTSGGNVGIGAANPGTRLTVTGTAFPVSDTIRTSAAGGSMYGISRFVHQTSSDASDGLGASIAFAFTDTGVTNQMLGGVGAIRNGADTEGALVFTAGTNGVDEFMRITSAGYVGIGTSTPGTQLEVRNPSAGVSYIQITDSTTGAGASNGLTVGYNGQGLVFNRENTDLTLGTNDTTRMVVDAAGNVGIGTNVNPNYLFDIYTAGGADPTFGFADGDIAHGLTSIATTNTLFHIGNISSTAGGARLTALSDTDAQAFELRGVMGSTNPTDTTPAIRLIGAKSNGTTGIADLGSLETVFQIANNDNSAALTILGNDNVGIGYAYTAPERLTVAGTALMTEMGSNTLAVRDNLVPNGGAEGTYVNGIAPDWQQTLYNTPTVNEETTIVHSGSKSQGVVADAGNEGVRTQTFSVTSGRQYLVSYWIYIASGTGVGANWYFGGGPDVQVFANTVGSWQQVSRVITASATSSSAHLLFFSQTSAATYYVDDVTVTDITNSNYANAHMRLDANGNLGLGTGNPIHRLQLTGGNGGNALAALNETMGNDILTASASGTTRLRIANNGSLIFNQASSIQTGTGNLTLDSAGELYFSDTRTGNIALSVADTAIDAGLGQGIVDAINDLYGLTIGNSLWSVGNGALYPVNSTLDLFIGGSSTASADFAFLNVNSGTPTASFSGNLVLAGGTRTIGSTDMNPLTIGTSTTGALTFAPAGTTAMTIAQGGNVGIGTTSPTAPLQVSSAIFPQLVLTGNANGNANQAYTVFERPDGTDIGFVGDFSASNQAMFLGSSVSYLQLQSASATEIRFAPGGTDQLRLYSSGGLSLGNSYIGTDAGAGSLIASGNVGIGTTTPTSKFHVEGLYGANALARFNQTGSGDILTASASGTTRMVLTNAGNLGVGTNIPIYPIQVTRTSGTPYVAIGESDTSNFAIGWDTTNNIGLLDTNSYGSPIRVNNGSLYISSGNGTGNVGVGSTGPGRALEINSANGSNLRLTYNDADGSATNYADLLTSSSGDLLVVPTGYDATFTGRINANATYSADVPGGLAGISNSMTFNTVAQTGYHNGFVSTAAFSAGATSFANYKSSYASILTASTVGAITSYRTGDGGPANAGVAICAGGITCTLNSGNGLLLNTPYGAGVGNTLNVGTNSGIIITGLNAYDYGGAVNVTTNYGAYFGPHGSSGLTLTHNYGIYMANQNGATTSNFAIVTNAGNIVFNEGGDANTDFRVEGDTNANLLFTDASTDRVGIGNNAPSTTLHVSGTGLFTSSLYVGGNVIDNGNGNIFINLPNTGIGLVTDGSTNSLFVDTSGNVSVGGDITPGALFAVGSTSQFQVNSSGNIAAIGGVAHSIADASGNLVLTSNGELYLNDTRTGNIALSVADTAIDAGLGQGIVDAINDLYSLNIGASVWSVANGSLFPNNSTLDLFIGGSSTASADFAFLNVSSGTPTASFSGNLVLAGGTRTIGSTNMNPLTIGTSTTGALTFAPAGSTAMTITQNGYVGIGTTNPTSQLAIVNSATSGQALNAQTSGTSGTSYAILGQALGASSGTNIGLYARANNATTNQALYIETLSPGANNYAIYSAATAQSYLAGSLGIGTTAPASRFHLYSQYGNNAAAIIDQRNAGDIFTASASGTTRFVITNAGDVGIGTNIPTQRLHVSGSSNTLTQVETTAAGNNYAGYNITTPEGTWGLYSGSTSHSLIPDGFGIYDADNATYRLAIGATGDVGIGTTSPGGRLDVRSSSLGNSATIPSILNVASNNAQAIDLGGSLSLGGYRDDAASEYRNFGIIAGRKENGTTGNASGYLQFLTNNNGSMVEGLRLTSGGLVGIGTTSPEGTLHVHTGSAGTVTASSTADQLIVEHSSEGGISVLTPDASNANIYLGSPTNSAAGIVRWNYNDNIMYVGTNRSASDLRFRTGTFVDAMTITDTGNVGIGRTAPSTLLEVVGTTAPIASVSTTLNTSYAGVVANSDQNGHNVIMLAGGSGRAGTSFGLNNNDLMQVYSNNAPLAMGTSNAYNLTLGTNNTARMTIASGGNVNIGTDTTPDALFSVGTTSQFQVNSSGNIAAIGGVAHSLADASGNLVLTSNGELYLNDTRTGNIALSVVDTAINAALGQGIVDAINDVYDTALAAGSKWTLGAGVLYPNNNTTDVFIGGTSTASADFAFLNVNSGTPTASFSGNLVLAGGTRSIQGTANNNLTIGGNTTGHIVIQPLNGSGYVGIGTTSPAARLNVDGDDTTGEVARFIGADRNYSLVQGGSLSGAGNFAIRDMFASVNRYEIDANGASMLTGNSSTGEVIRLFGGDRYWSIAQGGTYAPTTGGGGFGIRDNFLGETRLVIDQNGYTGIGNTNPNYRLAVTSAANGTGAGAGIQIRASDYGTNGGYLVFNKNSGASGTIASIQAGDNSVYAPIALQPDGGNVGVGTSNASALNWRFTIVSGADDLNTNAAFLIRASDWATNGGYLMMNKNSGNNTVATIQTGDNSQYTPLSINPLGGNVGIGGDSTPNSVFSVGSTSQFQINTSGNIVSLGGQAHTLSDSSTDLALDIVGGDLIFADGDVINIGGNGVDRAYNVIGDNTTSAVANMNSDDDLYVEGDLQGTQIYGSDFICTDCLDFAEFSDSPTLDASISITQNAFPWSQTYSGSGIAYNHTPTLTGGGIGYYVNPTIDPQGGTNAAPIIFATTTTNSTGNSVIVGTDIRFTNNPSAGTNTEYAMAIRNQSTSNTTDNTVTALLLLDNQDSSGTGSTVVDSGLLIRNTGNIAGGIVNAINIDDTDITTDIVFQNAETIDNDVNGTLSLTAPTVEIVGNLLPDADDTRDLGSSTLRWQDLYLGPSSLHIGTNGDEGIMSYNTTSNYFNFDQSIVSAGQIRLGNLASDPTSLGAGSLYYNTTTNRPYFHNGSSFERLALYSEVSGGGSNWTIANGTIRPTNGSLDFLLGGTATGSAEFTVTNINSGIVTASVSGALRAFGSDASTITTIIRGATSQTANLLNLQNSGGTNVFAVGIDGSVDIGTNPDAITDNAGNLQLNSAGTYVRVQPDLMIIGGDIMGNLGETRITFSDGVDTVLISGLLDVDGAFSVRGNTTVGDNIADTVLVNAAPWTFANDTTFALSGGIDGLNIDSNTLSIDALNNRLGLGTNAPVSTLHVYSASGNNAAALIDQRQAGDIFTASASGTTRMMLTNAGNLGIGTLVDPGYMLEIRPGSGDPTFGLSDPNVAHGVTTLAQTDTIFHVGPISSTNGGAMITGFAHSAAAAQALEIRGVMNSDPTNTVPAIRLSGFRASGTGVTSLAAAETLFQVRNNTTDYFTILGNGDVGVRDTTPDFDLDITNSSGRTELMIESTNSGDGYATLFLATNNGGIGNFDSSIIFQQELGTIWQITANYADSDEFQLFNGQLGSGTQALGIESATNRWTIGNGTGYLGLLNVDASGTPIFGKAALVVNHDENQDIFTASASGATRFVIQNSGAVGIGTNLPSRALDVNGGNAGIEITDTNSGGNSWVLTNVSTGDGTLGLYNATDSRWGWVTSDAGYVGFGGTTSPTSPVTVTTTVASGGSTNLIGLNGSPVLTGASTGFVIGARGQGIAQPGTSNTIGTAYGTDGIAVLSSAGTLSASVGVRGISSNTSTGTITNAFSMYADTIVNSGGGSVGTAYGLYISTQTVGGTNWNLFSGGSGNNHFTGDVSIGSTAAVLNSGNIPGASMIIGNGILCVDDGGDNCDDNPAKTAGNIYAEATGITAIDVAENYPSYESLTPGDLVVFDAEHDIFVKKTTGTNQGTLAGIVSTKPGVLLGGNRLIDYGAPLYPIALAGRVPTKVSTENGPIARGDALTSSSIPGVAMKATQAGQIVGRALETYSGTGVGTIEVFVNAGSYDPDVYLADTGEYVVASNGTSYDISKLGVPVSRNAAFRNLVAANARVGALEAEHITLGGNDLATTLADLQAQIASASGSMMNTLTSATDALVGTLTVRRVRPVASSDLDFDLRDGGSLTVTGANDTTVASVDNAGNAEFAGEVRSQRSVTDEMEARFLTATEYASLQNASIAGTLTANEVVINSARIDQLTAQSASVAGTLIADRLQGRLEVDQVENLEARVRTIVTQERAENPDTSLADLGITEETLASLLNTSAAAATSSGSLNLPDDLALVGTLTATRLIATQNLTIGDMTLAPTALAFNSADTFYIQPSAQGALNLLAGTMVVRQGAIDIVGSVKIDGSLAVRDEVTSATLASQSVRSEDLVASGSARLGRIVIASEDAAPETVSTSVQINATTGTATLPAGQTQFTINTSKVNAQSLVYVTPTSNTANQVLFVASKVDDNASTPENEAAFTVAMNAPIDQNITFNWWIVDSE